MLTQTPSTPSTVGVLDVPAFMRSEDVSFIDFTDPESASGTPSQWCEQANASRKKLWDILKRVPDDDYEIERMHPLTLHEEVEREIQRVMRGEISAPPTIDQIEERMRLQNATFSFPLRTMELASYYADAKFDKFFKNLKIQLPLQNAAPVSSSNTSDLLSDSISIQFYKTSGRRDLKLLEIDFPLHSSLLDLFTFVCAQFPNNVMFDGPVYAGSGLIVIGSDMYVTGEEDYSAPICNWLGPDTHFTVSQMDSCALGDMPSLTSLCSRNECGFLTFNGDEELRFYVSNITLSKTVASDSPVITFKRKLTRITRCVLCKTTAADLIVLNDILLPLNPSHCCSRCYRRLRADRNGQFIPPSPDTIVSLYRQI
jgi:hypothetical protein